MEKTHSAGVNRSGELKHLRLRRQLQELAQGLKPGEALPGERQLEEMFEVSRITVRRAISDLVRDGELVREKGKGTFVSHGMVRSVLHLASFNDDMRAAGFQPSTRVITAELCEPPDAAASHLRLAENAPAYRLRRLRLFHRRSFTGPEEPGTPIEYSISTYRSDRYQISMTLAQ